MFAIKHSVAVGIAAVGGSCLTELRPGVREGLETDARAHCRELIPGVALIEMFKSVIELGAQVRGFQALPQQAHPLHGRIGFLESAQGAQRTGETVERFPVVWLRGQRLAKGDRGAVGWSRMSIARIRFMNAVP